MQQVSGNYWGLVSVLDMAERTKSILSTNIPVYLSGEPFPEAMGMWLDKILSKAVLYIKDKQKDKYKTLCNTILEVSKKLNDALSEDALLRKYETQVQFRIFEVADKDNTPHRLTLKIYFNVVTKACISPVMKGGMALFTYISEQEVPA